MLEGRRISKTFGGLVALRDIDFKINKGEIVGLIGPNGAGKTTLINVSTGIYPPTSGNLWFDGTDITNMKLNEVCKLGMGRTFQICQPFLDLTVSENAMAGALFGRSGKGLSIRDAREKAEEALEFVGLKEKSQLPAKNLNVVELKKMDLARVLSAEPKLVLLDEMNTGLNPTETLEAMALIRLLRDKGMTVLIVEHIMKIVMSLSDRIIVLDMGQKIAEGTPSEVASDTKVVTAYLGEQKN